MRCQRNALLVTLSAVAALCLASVSSAVHAQQQPKSCTADTDCDKGFACQVVGSTACPGVACAEGQPCDASVPDCKPTEIKECVAGPCTADSDCATDMVCYATTQDCPVSTQPACDPSSSTPCPKVDPVPCTPKTVKTCTPRYLVPCTVDADCGDHFTCVQDQVCSCSGGGSASSGSSGSGSGSGGTPTPGAGDPAPQPAALAGTAKPSADASVASGDAGCECKNLDTKRCEPVAIPCTEATAATVCPAQWTCVQDVTGTGTGGGTACAVPEGADAAACPQPEPNPTPAPTPSMGACTPPYFATPGVAKGGVGNELGTGSGTPTQAGSADRTGHTAADAGAASGAAPKKSSGGICSVSSLGQRSAGHSLLAWLALAGLALQVRRRRNSAR